jgi:O-antigen/teichoic acid export membrane protein
VGAILAVLLYLGSDLLVTMILGASYIRGIVLAQILSAAVFFRLMNQGLCEVLTTSDRHSIRICLEGGLLLVNVILNLLLIPQFGGVGAATATVAAEVVLTIGVIWVCVNSKVFSK